MNSEDWQKLRARFRVWQASLLTSRGSNNLSKTAQTHWRNIRSLSTGNICRKNKNLSKFVKIISMTSSLAVNKLSLNRRMTDLAQTQVVLTSVGWTWFDRCQQQEDPRETGRDCVEIGLQTSRLIKSTTELMIFKRFTATPWIFLGLKTRIRLRFLTVHLWGMLIAIKLKLKLFREEVSLVNLVDAWPG